MGRGTGTIEQSANSLSTRGSKGPETFHLWHGTTSKRVPSIRPGFFATSLKSEAEDYAGIDDYFDEADQGKVLSATITLQKAKHYHGSYPGIASPEVAALPDQGYDGIVIHFAANNSDTSSPLPERTWVYAFNPQSVQISHA
jgi:hypothetical protein